MSNSLAIAAVTATLRSLLDRRINADPTIDPSADPALSGTVVTTRPLDEAHDRADGHGSEAHGVRRLQGHGEGVTPHLLEEGDI